MEFTPRSGESKNLQVRILNLKPAELAKRLDSPSAAPSGMSSATEAEAKAKEAITALLTKAIGSAPDDATKDIDLAQIAVRATSPAPTGTKLTVKSKTVPFQQANESQQKTWLASALKLTQGETPDLAIKYDSTNPTTLDVTLGTVTLDMWPGKAQQ